MDEITSTEHPLWSFARQGNLQAARDYLSTHTVSPIHSTVLFHLLLIGDFSAADTLVDAGVSVDGVCGGMRILGLAVAHGRTDMVRFLLEHGANPDLPVMPASNSDMVPIDLAKGNDNPEIVELISEYMSKRRAAS